MNSVKFIGFAILLLVLVFGCIEYFYGLNSCCECCETKEYVCEDQICEIEQCSNDTCCRCSFLKEYFGIDIYFWK